MKYKVTLKDGIELLITADKEVDAVRKAKDIKDSLAAGVAAKDSVNMSDATLPGVAYHEAVSEAKEALGQLTVQNEQNSSLVMQNLNKAQAAVARAKSNYQKWN